MLAKKSGLEELNINELARKTTYSIFNSLFKTLFILEDNNNL